MIRKQRNNKNIIVEDLYVGNTLYEGDNILKGWHEHFHNLAQPSGGKSPTLTNSGIEFCEIMLLIRSSR
jgi:hypothetical protein